MYSLGMRQLWFRGCQNYADVVEHGDDLTVKVTVLNPTEAEIMLIISAKGPEGPSRTLGSVTVTADGQADMDIVFPGTPGIMFIQIIRDDHPVATMELAYRKRGA